MKNHPALTEENLAAIRQLQQAIVNVVTIYENHKMLQPITTSTAQGLTALFEGCDNDLENHFQSTHQIEGNVVIVPNLADCHPTSRSDAGQGIERSLKLGSCGIVSQGRSGVPSIAHCPSASCRGLINCAHCHLDAKASEGSKLTLSSLREIGGGLAGEALVNAADMDRQMLDINTKMLIELQKLNVKTLPEVPPSTDFTKLQTTA